MAKISVIIPAYNAENYLAQTLGQVLSNRTPLEIIVIDDCSSDRTAEIANDFRQRFGNIVLLRNERNQGAGVSRNRAIEVATGDYFYFLDADDILQPGALDELAAIMDRTDCDFIQFRHQYLLSESGQLGAMYDQDRQIWDSVIGQQPSSLIEPSKAGQILVSVNYPWNKFYRGQFLRATGYRFSSLRIHEDIFPHWHGYFHARRVLLLNKCLITHREIQGREQHTNIVDARRLEVFAAFAEVEDLMARDRQLKDAYYHWFLYFKIDLLKWIGRNLDRSLMDRFFSLISISYDAFDDAEFHRAYPKLRDVVLASHTLKFAPHKLVV